ncbi:store-operated calcium entry-associated regulatory factor-like [Varroa jacobsoni]|uniref:store-operated calcium entry-associated regulatory factor-like n=1 Tax=Varroa jacobsoni TaxID=62625 RepID=UPI000BF9DBD7|nr:store-operated calcium entry-associated regulatory factor-like [Varroa jacobsoni]XP_022698729.1 store-operated calcium entry-associated regulatory factor-like [Varroa jacobsoni]XP_022698730.1 store-operated calcium entry-associated regulatory factor-like [Varroa jacobsoni]
MGCRTPVSALGLLLIGLSLSTAQWSGAKRIKEKDLEVITLEEGKYTTARRTAPVLQLNCLSGCEQTPKTVQCYNRGWDGNGNNWECKATLPTGVSFGQMDVNCEGFDYPDDTYITVGSCSLSYRLVGRASYSSWIPGKDSNSRSGIMFNLLFYGVTFILVITLYKACVRSMRYASDYGDGGFGTGGFPPGGPGFRPDYYAPGNGCGGNRPPLPNDGLGFWSGAMAGGLLGYLFGNRGDAYGYGGNYDYGQRQYRQPCDTMDDNLRRRDRSYNASGQSASTSQSSTGYATSSRR